MRHTCRGVRILLVNKFAHVTGGADQHCLDLAAALPTPGTRCGCSAPPTRRTAGAAGAFMPVSTSAGTRDQTRLLEAAPVFFKALWHRGAAAAMRRLAAEFRPDVVHAHKLYPQISVAPVVEAGRLGLPVVQTLHDFEMVSANHLDPGAGALDLTRRSCATGRSTRRRSRSAGRSSSRASGASSPSRTSRRPSHRRHGIDPGRDPQLRARRRPGRCPGWGERAGALYLGRLTEGKGVRDVVELARAAPDVPVDIVGFGELGDELAADGGGGPESGLPRPGAPRGDGAPPPRRARRADALARTGGRPARRAPGHGARARRSSPTTRAAWASTSAAVAATSSSAAWSRWRAAVRRILADEDAWAEKSAHGRRTVLAEHTPSAYVARLRARLRERRLTVRIPTRQKFLTNNSSSAVSYGYAGAFMAFRLVSSRTTAGGRRGEYGERTGCPGGREAIELEREQRNSTGPGDADREPDGARAGRSRRPARLRTGHFCGSHPRRRIPTPAARARSRVAAGSGASSSPTRSASSSPSCWR